MAMKMKDSGVEWIGEIPEDWEIERLKYQFDFGKGLAITKADLVEDGIGVISYGQIHSKSNTGTSLNDSLIRYISQDSEAITEASLLHEGDFVFADTSEDLDGCGNCIYVDADKELYAGYHTIILKNKKSNGKYLAYLFQTDNWRKQIRSKVSGVKVFSISKRILSEAINIIPPIKMQNKIVEILDAKCKAIEVSVEKANDSIVAYKSLKQSLITRAVTKGVRGKREMKDSGIEWIGEIPVTWSLSPIKNIGITSSGATPLRSKEKDFFDDADIPWIRTLDLNEGEIFGCSEKITQEALDSSSCSMMPVNTVCVAMYGGAGTIGKCGLLRIEATTNQAVCSIVCNKKIMPEYLLYHLIAIRKYWMYYAVGTRKDPNISQDIVGRMKVALPDLSEQHEIAAYLDEKCSAIDTLIAKKEQLISELETYKKSLIYEYVTGKREVPA